ncbi:MAG: hypothetical protein NT116_03620 [Candidatus Parcubacteria bacterium]|nr:hypothetical protein [Candidatus Parcubacteria bacterium]
MDKTKKEGFDSYQIVGYLAIIVIVISIAAMGVRLTGHVTSTGVVNVTIESAAGLNFTTNFINFGSGRVTQGQSSATIYSRGPTNTTHGNWTVPNTKFVLENIGNVNLTVTLMTNSNASGFIGGTNPSYQFNYTTAEVGSCTNMTSQTWQDVNTTSPGTLICSPLRFNSTSNTIWIDVRLLIPSDSKSGLIAYTDTFTATGTAAA